MSPAPPYLCPQCGQPSQEALPAGTACTQCRSQAAWSHHASHKLTITSDDIAQAERARLPEARRESRGRRSVPWAFGVLSLTCAGFAVYGILQLFAPMQVQALAQVMEALKLRTWVVLAGGLLALLVGAVSLVRMRRTRMFHNIPLIISHGAALAAGLVAAVFGVLGVLGGSLASNGWQYSGMPSRSGFVPSNPLIERIADATCVVVASIERGNAASPALGTCSVIARDARFAHVLTNSHVAMPYESPAAFRDAASADAVWIQFADGRGARGEVIWVGFPPLDVAVVAVAIAHAPPPIQLAASSAELQNGVPVMFVPNPYRNGWLEHHGIVRELKRHESPAGTFTIVHSDLPVQPGDSGSGLFNAVGQLVGINTWTRVGDGPSGISLPVEAVTAIAPLITNGVLDVERLRGLPGRAMRRP